MPAKTGGLVRPPVPPAANRLTHRWINEPTPELYCEIFSHLTSLDDVARLVRAGRELGELAYDCAQTVAIPGVVDWAKVGPALARFRRLRAVALTVRCATLAEFSQLAAAKLPFTDLKVLVEEHPDFDEETGANDYDLFDGPMAALAASAVERGASLSAAAVAASSWQAEYPPTVVAVEEGYANKLYFTELLDPFRLSEEAVPLPAGQLVTDAWPDDRFRSGRVIARGRSAVQTWELLRGMALPDTLALREVEMRRTVLEELYAPPPIAWQPEMRRLVLPFDVGLAEQMLGEWFRLGSKLEEVGVWISNPLLSPEASFREGEKLRRLSADYPAVTFVLFCDADAAPLLPYLAKRYGVSRWKRARR